MLYIKVTHSSNTQALSITGFEHCNRESIIVANELARGAEFSTTYDWFQEHLNDIVSLLIENITVIQLNKTLLLLKKTWALVLFINI